MSMNILVVDDEKEIADVIELYLQNDQYNVYKFYTGQDALDCIKNMKIDLAILDIMLPDVDGFQILKQIREKYTFPVIMLTAKTEYMDKITGLTLGADDYIPKPFNPLELVARVKAQIRRYTQYNEGGNHVNPKSLGYRTCTYVGIKLEKGSMYKSVVAELQKIPEIVECHFTTGPYTMLTKLYACDNEHLMDLLNNKMQEIPGVVATETLISLEQSIKKEIPIRVEK